MNKYCMSLLFLYSLGLQAESLVVGISGTTARGIPETVATIKAALLSTNLELDIREFPGERSIVLLTQGEIAIDVYRQPAAVAMFADLIQIKPSVGVLEFWLVTHKSNAYLCQLNEAQRSRRTVVGVRGARFYGNYVYDNFLAHEKVNNFSQVLEMIRDKRVDFSVWPVAPLENALKDYGFNAHVCKGKPYLTLKFYSYIHKNYSWAIPKIEKAYREYFLK